MITTRRLTPEVYYNESRDFQLIGRIFEVAFNNVKTGVDLLANNPFNKNLDDKLVDLLAKTVGFDTKHKYTVSDLKIVCSSFKEMMRKKGSKEAIELLVRSLLKAQNIDKQYLVEIFTTKAELPSAVVPEYFQEFTAIIEIPYELKDKVLIEDVLDYILPAGCNYRIIQAEVNDLSSKYDTAKGSFEVSSEEFDVINSTRNGAAELNSDIEIAVIGENHD